MPQQINLNDRVRFLNAVGGGIVSAFQGKDIVIVLEDDGFETPVLRRDVVVVEETNEYNFPVSAAAKSKEVDTTEVGASGNRPSASALKAPEYTFNEKDETPEGEWLNIFLGFVPVDVKKLQTCDMDVYLINDSNYYLDFTLAVGETQATMKSRTTIEPQTKLLIDTIKKTDLNAWEWVRFQALPYKQRDGYTMKRAVDVSLKLNQTKFFKLHAFKENDYFDEDAILSTILKDDEPDLTPRYEVLETRPEAFRQAVKEKEQRPRQPQAKSSKPNDVIEVDLHINELIDNTKGLTNTEMLEYQLKAYRETMDKHIKHKGQRIVFIHGNGEGVLRAALEKDLKRNYPTCRVFPAPFQKYGHGAKLVIIG